MGRTHYALMSLVAAVPGALLVIIIVLGFLQHADGMPGVLTVVAGLTLLIAAALAATPVGILLFGGARPARAPKAAPANASAKAAKKKAAPEEADESFVTDEDDAEVLETGVDDDWNEGDSVVDIEESEFMGSDDEFELDDESSSDFDADFSFDDDDNGKKK